MTVYAVNHVDLDLSGAEQYGDLKFINPRYVFGDDLDQDNRLPAPFVERMERAAERFDPSRDYLLIAGDHLQLAAFAGMLAVVCRGYRALRFDRMARGYWVAYVDYSYMRTCTPDR